MGIPLVSIIIPTKNSGRTLNACLLSCKQQTYSNIEIIVVDNFSDDTTKEISLVYTDLFFSQGPERSAQRNYGVQQSSGSIVLIIDSDMQLAENVVAQCVKQFDMDNALLALVIPEESFGSGFRAQCKKLERSYYVGIDRMEAARCFRKETFLAMNGYDEESIAGEDYDLPQRIEEQLGKQTIGRIDALIYHNEGNLSLWKSCKKKFYYGQGIHSYIEKQSNKKKFINQSGLIKRYSIFFSSKKIIQQSPIIRFGMLFMKTCEFSSLFIGYITSKIIKVDNIY